MTKAAAWSSTARSAVRQVELPALPAEWLTQPHLPAPALANSNPNPKKRP
jgi:hypothetical protein